MRTSSKSHATLLWKTALSNAKYFKRSISTFNTAWHTVRLNVEPCVTSLIQGFSFTESGEWYLEKVYDLNSTSKATHLSEESKSAVTYVIHIRREVFYYFVYLITPCMMTSFMTLILFTLPPESGERMVMGVTILLSLAVFYLLASTHIPETSEVVPLIGRYGDAIYDVNLIHTTPW